MKPSRNLPFRGSLAFSLAILLAACGSDDDNNNNDDSSSQTPPPPSISINSAVYSELADVVIDPDISSDATISSYSWEVVSGDITLDATDNESVTFTAPAVAQDTTANAALRLTVTDEFGQRASKRVNVSFESVSPIVSIDSLTVIEKEDGTIVAEVDDNGQTIASSSWEQLSGPDISFTDNGDYSIDFTAPETTQVETAVFELTVEDGDGDIVKTSVQLRIENIAYPVTISGLATDNPLANAEISILVADSPRGELVFTDASGNYTIAFSLDDSELSELVTVIARGVDTQSMAELVSVLGSAQEVVDQAGSDGLLESSDNHGVNVTHVSTAVYALASLGNSNEDFETADEYRAAAAKVEAAQILNVAAAIKVAIDMSSADDSLKLPDGFDTTLDLSADATALNEYIQSVSQSQAFLTAQQETFSDEAVFANSGWQLENAYYPVVSGLYAQAGVRRFKEDGTYSEGIASGDYNFDGNTLTYMWNRDSAVVWDNGVSVEVPCVCNATYVVKRLSSDAISETWLYEVTSSDTYESPYEANNRSGVFYYTEKVTPQSRVVNQTFADSQKLLLEYSQSDLAAVLEGPGEYWGADEFVLSADGTGRTRYTDQYFTWTESQGAFSISVNGFDFTWTSADALGQSVAWEGSVYDLVGLSANAKQAIGWTPESVLGYYTYDRSIFSNYGGLGDHFWFEVFEDGTARVVHTVDSNGDQIITIDEVKVYQNYTWEINDGVFTMIDLTSGFRYIREWTLGRDENNEITVLQAAGYPDYPDYFTRDIRSLVRISEPPIVVDR